MLVASTTAHGQSAWYYDSESTEWVDTVGTLEEFPLSPANIALAGIPAPAGPTVLGPTALTFTAMDTDLCTTLVFNSISSSSWSYGGLASLGFDVDHISPQPVNTSGIEDWTLSFDSESPVYVVSFELYHDSSYPEPGDHDIIYLYGLDDALIDSFVVTPFGSGNGLTRFVGLVASVPIKMIYFQSGPIGDDFGIANLQVSCQNPFNQAPSCTTEGDVTVECDDSEGALVTLLGSASDPDDDDNSLMFNWEVSDANVVLDDPSSPSPSGVFPLGVTMATLTVTDGRGGIDVCDVTVTVRDTTPPEVMCTTNVAFLWPPNHRMKTVDITILALDECEEPDDITPLLVTVRSDEPDDADGTGDGATTGDVNGWDGFTSAVDLTGDFVYAGDGEWVATIELRAEREGTGNGRAYTIDVLASDSHGNLTITSCVVVVPHDRRRN